MAARQAAVALAVDFALYLASAAFATATAMNSTLAPHRMWGTVATPAYLAAALVTVLGLAARGRTALAAALSRPAVRSGIAAVAWALAGLLPLIVEALERAHGEPGRAQNEVAVIEQSGRRLWDSGTPYLGSHAIAALPPGSRLTAYLPYQPGMALFGLPRALGGDVWWTDARIYLALLTGVAVVAALGLLPAAPTSHPALLRAAQAATVLPVCALAMATGGDDLPVLALCLLALALAARRRYLAAGLAVGVAGALKLFAWPVAVVLLVLVAHRQRGRALGYALGALGVPLAVLVPPLLANPDAVVENTVRFPLGHGLVVSPARSPLPGHLIASGVPGGHVVAAVLLLACGSAIAGWLVRHPPSSAAGAAAVSAIGLAVAILLMPSTRFGYLLYPVAYAAWIPALYRAEAATSTPRAENPVARLSRAARPSVASPSPQEDVPVM
ncbi:MAG TPA: glycosyltransferase 87 family protein [Micromonosporaceae bacterium]